MQRMELTKTQKALSLLTGIYDRFTEERAGLYAQFLGDIPDEVLTAAIKSLILTSKFPPTIAEIREEAERIYRIASGKQIPTAGEAWNEALKAVREYGYYQKPKFSSPLIEEAVRRFGWEELNMQPMNTIGVARGQFMKIYDSVASERRGTKRIEALIGNERVNRLISNTAKGKMLNQGKADRK